MMLVVAVCALVVALTFALTRCFYKNRFEKRIVELECEVMWARDECRQERQASYEAEMKVGFLEMEKDQSQRREDARFEGQLPKPPRPRQSELVSDTFAGDENLSEEAQRALDAYSSS